MGNRSTRHALRLNIGQGGSHRYQGNPVILQRIIDGAFQRITARNATWHHNFSPSPSRVNQAVSNFFKAIFESIGRAIRDNFLIPITQYAILIAVILILEDLCQAVYYGLCMIFVITFGEVPYSIKNWTLEHVAEFGSCDAYTDSRVLWILLSTLNFIKWMAFFMTIGRMGHNLFRPNENDSWDAVKNEAFVTLLAIACVILVHVGVTITMFLFKVISARLLLFILHYVMICVYFLRFNLFV